jgi:hypothetical protein
MSESSCYEEKSQFNGDDNSFLDIAKTIIGFANCDGGIIRLKGVSCDVALLDSARIDDRVNHLVAPRIRNITSIQVDNDSFAIEVAPSEGGPHVIAHTANYKLDDKGQRPAFHQGQIYVRHSSKSEPATEDDVRWMINKAVSRVLASLSEAMKNASISVAEGGLSILSPETALKITTADVNTTHPHTATDLGKLIGKSWEWTSAAVRNSDSETIRNAAYEYWAVKIR